MKINILWNPKLLVLLTCLLLLGGCGGTNSYRFYTLNPSIHFSSDRAQSALPLNSPSSIGIVSVEIPDYLDRPQIVTRNMSNELTLAEFDRWAGDLQKDIARILAETMSSYLADTGVFIQTGRQVVPGEYRIAVQIDRFEAMPDRRIWLKALWTVLEKNGRRVLVRGESNISEAAQGMDYGATVAAMSRTVGMLGNEIAGAIKPTLIRKTSMYNPGDTVRPQAPVADGKQAQEMNGIRPAN